MIRKLNNHNGKQSEEILELFHASYAVEAKLLKAKDFPPLKRTLNQFIQARTHFYGYFLDETLTAAVEIKTNSDLIHIQSLVVSPDYFRRGIASQLMQFILTKYKDNHLTVETGLANKPAVTLYKKNGFKQTKQFNTSHGIRKIRLEKSIDNL